MGGQRQRRARPGLKKFVLFVLALAFFYWVYSFRSAGLATFFTWSFQVGWALLAGWFFVRPFWPARRTRLFAVPCWLGALAVVTAFLHQPALCILTRSFPPLISKPSLAYAVVMTFTLVGPLAPLLVAAVLRIVQARRGSPATPAGPRDKD